MTTLSAILDPALGAIFQLTGNQEFNYMFGILSMAVLISSFVTAVRARVLDPTETKRLKEELSDLQKRYKEAQKNGSPKKVEKVQKQMAGKQSAMMGKSFKPMIFTSLPIIFIFRWLRGYRPLMAYVASHGGTLARLPFSLPHFGSHLGWFGWYILCSFAISNMVKIVLKVEM